jgi:hypothetical protein
VCHPLGTAAAGVHARCFALGVRSEAVSAIYAFAGGGSPPKRLWRPTLSQTIRGVKVLGSRARRGGRGECFALEMGGLEPPTPCLQSRCSPS